jgi:hypothetical protein
LVDNRTLVGRPQLGGTVMLDAGIAPYLIRRLALGDALRSGRYLLSLGRDRGRSGRGPRSAPASPPRAQCIGSPIGAAT